MSLELNKEEQRLVRISRYRSIGRMHLLDMNLELSSRAIKRQRSTAHKSYPCMEQPRDRYDAAWLALLLELDSLIVGLGFGALYQDHYLLLGMSGTQQSLLLGMGRTQQSLLLGMGGTQQSLLLGMGEPQIV